MPTGMYPGLSGEQLAEQSKAANALVNLANRLLHSEVLVRGCTEEQVDILTQRLSIDYAMNTEQGAES